MLVCVCTCGECVCVCMCVWGAWMCSFFSFLWVCHSTSSVCVCMCMRACVHVCVPACPCCGVCRVDRPPPQAIHSVASAVARKAVEGLGPSAQPLHLWQQRPLAAVPAPAATPVPATPAVEERGTSFSGDGELPGGAGAGAGTGAGAGPASAVAGSVSAKFSERQDLNLKVGPGSPELAPPRRCTHTPALVPVFTVLPFCFVLR